MRIHGNPRYRRDMRKRARGLLELFDVFARKCFAGPNVALYNVKVPE